MAEIFSIGLRNMRIGELSKRSGVQLETIRFYESKGLLQPAMRLGNNYRVYGEEHLARLHFIRHCRALDIGLDEIGMMVNCRADDPAEAEKLHEVVTRHVREVSERIAELKILRKNLMDLALCCNGEHCKNERCGIITSLENYDHEGCGCCDRFASRQKGE